MEQNMYTQIKKEQILLQQFVLDEVLSDQDQISKRKQKLSHAIKLGKLFYEKVRIVFETSEGPKSVIERIWEASSKYVILKGGMIIPLCCIKEIDPHGML